jgi:hypothetical protein
MGLEAIVLGGLAGVAALGCLVFFDSEKSAD